MRAAWFGILGLGAALAVAAAPAAGQSPRESELSKERAASPGADPGPSQKARARAKAKAKAKAKAGGQDADKAGGGAAAGPGATGNALGGDFLGNMYRSGHYRLIQERLKSTFQANPDDPDAHCMLGIAYENAGRYADAYTSLELGMGSTICDREGLGPMANTLRALGRGDEAARVRLERLLQAEDADTEVTTLLELVDDYRAAGDRLAAWDAAMRAWAIMPRGALVLATLADLAMDDGDIEEAQRLMWLTKWVGDGPPAVRLTSVRLAMVEGDLDRAEQLLVELRPRTKRLWKGSVLQAELRRRADDPEAAQLVLDAKYLRGSEYPALLAEQVLVQADLDQWAEAEMTLDRALSLYPTDPDVSVAAAYLQNARKSR